MADWTTTIQGLAPLAFGAVGALTAQPNTLSSTKQNTFLTPGSEGLFNQGVGLAGQAGTQPYVANSWIENAQRMLGATALDTTPGDVIGQTAETLGGLSNRLNNAPGGSTWNTNPGAMQTAIENNMNPWNNLVRDQTMGYAQDQVDRANTADRAGAAANASGFGDRSQIALELGQTQRQRGLDSLYSSLNQTGFNNALAQANTNNATERADIGQLGGLALQQPGLAQLNRATQIGNAQLLNTEGTAQRDFPWTQANNLINAGTKGMGTSSLTSTPTNPWTSGISAGLAALSPAVQTGIGNGVNALSGLFSAGTSAPDLSGAGLDSIFGTDYGALGSAGADATSAMEGMGIFFNRGGRAKRFRRGGLARFADGGTEETPRDVPAEELPPAPQMAPRQSSRAAVERPATGDLEAEFMRRLMRGPDPEEMRAARDSEQRSIKDLMSEYAAPKDDNGLDMSNLGAAMAASGDQNLGTAFAKGVGVMNQQKLQRDQLERQAKRELAQIQLRMSSENRKELTEAERTRLTTLASLIRERNQAESNRQLREAQIAQTGELGRARLEESRRQHDMMALMHQQGLDLREASMVAPLIAQLRTQAAASIDAQLKANNESMDEAARNALIEERVSAGLPKLLETAGIRPGGRGPAPGPSAQPAGPPGPVTMGGAAAQPLSAPGSAPGAGPGQVPGPQGEPPQGVPPPVPQPQAAPPPGPAAPPAPAPTSQSGLPGARPNPVILSPADVSKQTQALTGSMKTFQNVDDAIQRLLQLNTKIPDDWRKTVAARTAGTWASSVSGRAPDFVTNLDEYDKDVAGLIIDLASAMQGTGRQTDAFRQLVERSKPEVAKTQEARRKVLEELKQRIDRERAFASHAYQSVTQRRVMPSFDEWLGTQPSIGAKKWGRDASGKPVLLEAQ